MSSVAAIVKSIVGQVFVVSPEGVRRVLVEGDKLFAGDQIDTGLSGAVSLELADGRTSIWAVTLNGAPTLPTPALTWQPPPHKPRLL